MNDRLKIRDTLRHVGAKSIAAAIIVILIANITAAFLSIGFLKGWIKRSCRNCAEAKFLSARASRCTRVKTRPPLTHSTPRRTAPCIPAKRQLATV